MSDSKQDRGETGLDQKLNQHFSALRTEEAITAPPVPGPVVELGATPGRFRASNAPRALPAMAAVLALAFIGAGLPTQRAEEDPAQLYASIMATQNWHSDGLLVVSDSLMPAMTGLPELYQIDTQFDPDTVEPAPGEER